MPLEEQDSQDVAKLAAAVETVKVSADGDAKKATKKTRTASKNGKQAGERRYRMLQSEFDAHVEERNRTAEFVEKNVKGKVKWYSILNRYGFIGRDDGKEDVFVHQTAISNSRMKKYYLRTLTLNEAVEFDIIKSDKGEQAINVSGPNNTPVIGSQFYFLQIPKLHKAYTERRDGHQKDRHGKNEKHHRRRSQACENAAEEGSA